MPRSETGWSSDTGLGYGTNATAYGAASREGWSETINYNNPKPTFICPNKNDAFTKEDKEKRNGKLREKVGLITVDEIVATGSGKYNLVNRSYYLYKGNDYWSLSPSDSSSIASMFAVSSNGNFTFSMVTNEHGGVPVISLTPEYVSNFKGQGTMESPYEAP